MPRRPFNMELLISSSCSTEGTRSGMKLLRLDGMTDDVGDSWWSCRYRYAKVGIFMYSTRRLCRQRESHHPVQSSSRETFLRVLDYLANPTQNEVANLNSIYEVVNGNSAKGENTSPRRPGYSVWVKKESNAVLLFMIAMGLANFGVRAHGRMTYPAARNTAWRYGFSTPINYNDNELFCGGLGVQWDHNRGRCGICGDPWNLKKPRPYERGGIMTKGLPTAFLKEGQVLSVEIVISTNHKGYFEFRLCANNNPKAQDSQRCLDKNLLEVVGNGLPRGTTRYLVAPNLLGPHTVHVRLPRGISCSHCVLQWRWRVGNNWGFCRRDGEEAIGCGPQETYVNCADVVITPKQFLQGRQIG
ncbi:uncharacterized protein LOC143040118 [Oratosquilla oratoria]|uniref:uncharacterized protein LOC143040118 n=1 Tax=Oratosquilla oratoria TaxID=337810 RepID=UPI003F75EB7E